MGTEWSMERPQVPGAYNEGDGFPWDNVMGKAVEILEQLIKQKYSGQDIAHIGLRLQLMGNHIWNRESLQYLKETKK